MKRLCLCVFLIALAVACRPAAAEPVRGEAKAVMVEKGPAVDGTLADPLWAKAAVLVLGDATSSKPAAYATTARLLFGPTRLYLAVECAEPGDQVVATTTERDGPAYAGDSVEFFVTGDARADWYQFVVNAKGALYDATFSGSREHAQVDAKWNSTAVAKTSFEPGKRWIVTLAIPLAEISAYVGENQPWVMNVCRNRPGRDGGKDTHMSWSVLPSVDYHLTGDYGLVEGVDIPRREDGVTRTAEAIAPPPKFLAGEPHGEVVVYRSWDTLTIPNVPGKGTMQDLPLPIKGPRGLKVVFLARGTGTVASAGFNMYDLRTQNNTTTFCYRWVDASWRPIVYYVEDFHYNGTQDTVAANAQFRSILFHGNGSTDGSGELQLRNMVVYRGDDRTPPTAPTGLKADGAKLTWQPATDNTAVACYVVQRAGEDGKFVKVGQTTECNYLNTVPNARYRVMAVDFEDNLGPWSDTATVAAAAMLNVPPVTQVESDRRGYAANVRAIHAAGEGKVIRGRAFCYGDSHTNATIFAQTVQRAIGRFQMRSVGYSGIQTGGALKNLDGNLEKYNPEFCLVLLGTNNGKSDAAIAAAMKDLMAMAERCKARGTVAAFLTIPPRGFGETSDPEKRYNEALIRTCRENGYPVAYCFEPQMAADRREIMLGDGLHMKPAGVELAAKAWQQTMDQVMYAILDRD